MIKKLFHAACGIVLLTTAALPARAGNTWTDGADLQIPAVGANTLRVLTPTLLELHLINTKAPDPATVTNWNFVDSSFNLTLPSVSEFVVMVNGSPALVQAVGFKRRPLYAPLETYDLRIDNCLYLQLATPIADNAAVTVLNPDGTLWGGGLTFSTTANPLRYSPAIHVNQEGYMPNYPKKAIVGYYLGSLGEMTVPTTSFSLVGDSGATVFTGTLTLRQDVGYTYAPTPYQKVYEADFSSFNTPGEYRLVVPGLGASLPFLIDQGIAMDFARTYELGIFEQRSGYNVAMPFTRFTHAADHTAPASVPVDTSSAYTFTWNCIAGYANQPNGDNPPQTAPLLTDPSKQLFPFINPGPIDVSGGHFDAGDYSKYTWDMAQLVHALMFAVDSLPGVAQLDNLGIPESGDGISDIMQEAKWESDCLAKLQDADGGFYYVVYPQYSEYETSLPEYGSPQVVWPKNTAATAAAVAALAECASSPLFKQTYPQVAANYLAKAQLGWQFLTNAIAKYGKTGAYQKMMHFGDDFTDQDDLAWAACEMFLATGDPSYQATLESWFPDPTSSSTFLWGWWRMYGGWGNAVRDYAFAVKSGRLQASQLDASYLAKCITTITNCANDNLLWSQQSAYGSSFPTENKAYRSAGWYYSPEQAFNIVVGYQFNPNPAYLDAILRNVNYEGGCNPVNQTFVTGLGWKRQRQLVDQYSEYDQHVLPKDGIPIGNIQSGFAYVNTYGSELTELCYPNDNASTAPYPYYDRWADAFNVTTEASTLQTAHSLDTVAWLAAQTALKTQAWTYAAGQIQLPASPQQGQPVTVAFAAPSGMDLSAARIVWEAQGAQPAYGNPFTFTPTNYGSAWIEAEAQWPDGRRVFAVTNLFAQNALPTVTVAATSPTAVIGSTNYLGVWTFTRAGDASSALTVNYNLGGTAVKWDDYYRYGVGDMPTSITIPAGSSSATLTIYARNNETGANPEYVTLSLASDPAYNVGSPYSATINILPAGSTVTNSTDTTPPTVSITAPGNGATVSGPAVAVSASASDNVGVTSVQFKWDGANLGSPFTAAPYAFTLDTTTVANGQHTLSAVASDAAGNQTTSAPVTITVNNLAATNPPPTVSITAPGNGATVSGSSVTVSANASSSAGIASVQFQLDGANLGAAFTAPPYAGAWDTTTVANGAHTLTAVATDTTGNQTTSTPVSVTVSNATAGALGNTVIWCDDALPAGASGFADGGDSWNWISNNPAPYSGALAHQSAMASGLHEHYFTWATTTLNVSTGNVLFAYVYLDPTNPPSEIMLGWDDSNGSWEHRAYWGANNITYGADGTAGRYYMGPLPAAGQWVWLQVPASAVNCEGATLQGMDFACYNGRATWDAAGQSASTNPPPSLPTVSISANPATAVIGTTNYAVVTIARTGDTTQALTVNYTLGGTAVKWDDYYHYGVGDMPTSVTIPAGAILTNLVIAARANETGANPETATFTLNSDPGYAIGSPASVTITIVSNTVAALPVVTVAATAPNASRVGPTNGVFTFTRTGDTSAALTVNYSLGGTATNGVDYSALGPSLTIPAGAVSFNLTVAPLPSTNFVSAETAVLRLVPNAAYTTGAASNATVTIAGNSVPSTIGPAPGHNVKITWSSVVGKIYRVAYKTSLTDTVWTNLSGLITATGTTTSYTDTTASKNTTRYYVVYVTD